MILVDRSQTKVRWHQSEVTFEIELKPRGRVWGGSSSLNAMAYVRGHAEDYNRSKSFRKKF